MTKHRTLDGYVGYSMTTERELEAILARIPTRGYVLEIGTHHGASVAYWAARRPTAVFVSVDRTTNTSNWQRNRRANMALLVGDSSLVLPVLRPALFDLVFVDAGHNYLDCTFDLQGAVDLLAPDGVFAVHDYGAPKYPGVKTATGRFCEAAKFVVVEQVDWTAFLRRAV